MRLAIPLLLVALLSASPATLDSADRERIDALLAQPALEHAQLALVVRSLGSGETLYRANGAKLLIPASTLKVVTSAVAADRLGWQYRFETRLLAAGRIAKETLDGDLVVVGGGDPTLNRRHEGRDALFDAWAAAVKAAGIFHVTGRIVGVDDAFAEPGWGPGWSWEDLAEGYGAPVGALQYNESEVDVQVGPGRTPGLPAIVALSPGDHDLLVDNQAVTAAPGTPRTVTVSRPAGTRFLLVAGDVPMDGGATELTTTAANPTTFYAAALRSALQRNGIRVDGDAADFDEVRRPPDLTGARTLAVDLSPPLTEVVDVTLKWSRNEYAETMLRALDLGASSQASNDGGLDTVRATLARWGVPEEGYRIFDGSGLSRYDGLSADALVTVLGAVWQDERLRDPFVAALPLAGDSGTLAQRMTGGPAKGRVWAKTGSMFNVRTLAGYVQTAGGDTLAVAFMANGFTLKAAEIDEVSDEILQVLAAIR
jgi:D-alanyl-D-alanine carboxypeptidase/D-alanyl-D-alanine-endopeptidase (penicillin-binding protein 4)